MRIAVIGAGNIGGTIGDKLAAAGHEVTYGLREPAKKAGARSMPEACADADAVILAIPGDAVVDFVRAQAEQLDGKVVIDATNNPRAASMNSWAEIAPLLPNAALYRAFNEYGWDVFANPRLGGEEADLFYCGPEGDAKAMVEGLIADAGLRPIWVGGPDAVGVIDGVLRLWFSLARTRGRRIAFKLIAD